MILILNGITLKVINYLDDILYIIRNAIEMHIIKQELKCFEQDYNIHNNRSKSQIMLTNLKLYGLYFQ